MAKRTRSVHARSLKRRDGALQPANVVLSGGLCPSASRRCYVGLSRPIWLRYSESICFPSVENGELARALKLSFEHDCTFGVDNAREVQRLAVSHQVVVQQQKARAVYARTVSQLSGWLRSISL